MKDNLLRILWIGKAPLGGDAGDEIYDRKIVAALRADGALIETFAPVRVSRPREVLNLARGVPHYRSWYESRANREGLRRAAESADVILSSWEPFDRLAFSAGRPVIPILHNVTSQALSAIHPGHAGIRLAAWRAGAWERHAYGSGRFAAIGVLSVGDRLYLGRHLAPTRFVYAPPGMPPLVDLRADAPFVPEILISGTFDWTPKRRDILAFARDYADHGSRVPIHADRLPEAAARLLRPAPLAALDTGSAIRLGLIPDRFRAGHKLKTSAYIAANAVVLSYSDVREDFSDIVDCDLFIRLVRGPADIEAAATELGRMAPSELRARFRRFQRACADRFCWTRSARALLEAATAAVAA